MRVDLSLARAIRISGRYVIILVCAIIFLPITAVGQNFDPYVTAMNKALDGNAPSGSHGSLKLIDGHVLRFRLDVPGPEISLPVGGGATAESTRWSGVALDFSEISADLKSLDEGAISEHLVFSADGISNYKTGDEGDMVVVDFGGEGEPSISITTVDRKKLQRLPSGTATGDQLGEATRKSTTAHLVFTDRNLARTFEKALRAAIVVAEVPTN